jgi:hypothetical protein
MTLAKTLTIAAGLTVAVGLGAGLCACTTTPTHLRADFGAAVRQDAMAQIVDPDVDYRHTPAPPSDGARAELAQERYRVNQPIEPVASASKIGAAAPTAASAPPAPATGP